MLLRCAGWLALLCLAGLGVAPADACPICHTELGEQVRRGIFNERFSANVLLTLLPFPLFLGFALLLYYERLPIFRHRDQHPASGRPNQK